MPGAYTPRTLCEIDGNSSDLFDNSTARNLLIGLSKKVNFKSNESFVPEMGQDYIEMDGYGKVYLKESDFAADLASSTDGSLVVNCSYHGSKHNLFNNGTK